MERAVPILWMVAAGIILACARIARASIPLALLILWAGLRAMYHSFPLRSLQVLLLFLMAGLLYAAARDLSDRHARIVGLAILVGVGYEWGLGLLNAFRIYPFMAWISPEHVGKGMGFLTHPNYWGSFMALGLPLVWAYLGIPAAALVFILILKTVSPGPVICAAVGAAVMAWPLFGRAVRFLVVAVGAGSIVGTLTLHEWRLSGRSEVWSVALPEIMRWPVLGQGLGQWRQWAEDYNRELGKFFVTLQAHNEPLQLWFELGVIGLLIATLWVAQGVLAARVVWRAAPAAVLPAPEDLWRSIHRSKEIPAIWLWIGLAALGGIAIWGLASGVPLWSFWFYAFWFVAGLGVAGVMQIKVGRAPLERAWVAMVAVAAVNSLGSPLFHLMPQAAVALFALARVQADAEALGPREIQQPKRDQKAKTKKARGLHAGQAD